MDEPLLKKTLSVWRTVLSPLDPFNLSPWSPPADGRGVPRSETRFDVTRWWIDALADGPRAWPQANARLLVELADQLVRRFGGKRIDLAFGPGRVRAVLDSIRLDRGDPGGARLEFSQVEWDGLRFERLVVVVRAITLTPPPDVSLTVSGIELEGRSPMRPLVAWLDHKVPRWGLGVSDDGLVEVAPRRGGMRLLIHPVVIGGTADVELRAVRWRGVRVRLPTWLQLTRQMPLPALPNGLWLSEARRRGSDVELRLSVPTLRRPLDPSWLREALSRKRRGTQDDAGGESTLRG